MNRFGSLFKIIYYTCMIKKFIFSGSTVLIMFLIAIAMSGCGNNNVNEGEGGKGEQTVNKSAVVGNKACYECHSNIDTAKMSGPHKDIDCEKCHGPGAMHLSDPIVYSMKHSSERAFCAGCHAKDSAKSAGIKQIDPAVHNTGKKCIECHDPHNTGFGTLAGKGRVANSNTCNLCHAKINQVRLKGVHKTVECESCHSGWEKHLVSPRATKPLKPTERAFCGKCHGKGISTSGNIKKIDLKEHNIEAKCIECHNPHSPWE
jgi:hypothetical protein